MEWMKITLQKETITNENKTEFLEEGSNHTKQQKSSFNASIEKTQLVIGTMISKRNHDASFSNHMNMNSSSQQDEENKLVSGETFNMIENCELGNANEVREQKEATDSKHLQSTDACIQSNVNLNVFGKNNVNSPNNTQDNKSPSSIDFDSSYTNGPFGSSIIPAGDFNRDETLVKYFSEVRKKLSGTSNINVNENVKNVIKEVEKESLNKNEIKSRVSSCKSVKPENMPKCTSKGNIFSDSNFSEISQHSKDIIVKNAHDDKKGIIVNFNSDCSKITPLAKEKVIKNNVNVNNFSPVLSGNGIKRNEFKTIAATKSVTDLINYFENLKYIKCSSVKNLKEKSERKSLKCEEKMKFKHTENTNTSYIKSNAFSNLSGSQMMKKGCNKSESKSLIKTSPKIIVPHGNINKCRKLQSPTVESEFCNYPEGNCDPIEQIKHRPEDKVESFKEHIFIFPDESKKNELPLTPSSSYIRSRFTRKMNRPHTVFSVSESFYPKNDEKVDLSLLSNETKENRNFLKSNTNQAAFNIFFNDRKNRLCTNQDSKNILNYRRSFLPQNEYTNSTQRVFAGKVFIGICLSAIICVAIWKGVYEYRKIF